MGDSFFFKIFFTLVLIITLCFSPACGNQQQDDDDDGDKITVQRFGGAGTSDGKFGNQPHGIAIDADGFVYVSDTSRNLIQKFSANGVFVDKWTCQNPYGSIVYDKRFHVCSNFNKIRVFELDGTPFDSWDVPDVNDRSGGMAVVDMDVDPDGVFYVLDNIDRAVKIFSTTGLFQGSFRVDSQDPLVWGPLGIAIASGQVFITDAANHKVTVWTPGGAYVRTIGTQGSQDGQFFAPSGIAVMNGNSIIVGDINGAPTFARIQKFSLSGAFRSVIKPDNGGFYPNSLAVNPGGSKIYICYSGTFEIRIVDTF